MVRYIGLQETLSSQGKPRRRDGSSLTNEGASSPPTSLASLVLVLCGVVRSLKPSTSLARSSAGAVWCGAGGWVVRYIGLQNTELSGNPGGEMEVLNKMKEPQALNQSSQS
ncbi:hypothetical protein RRG08_041449 [Elysia crispata]|uniref:Uncharacterized protein n=1 Tax=Elysia crispata TaxID=231223 RepID=A0AAE1ALP3_9GAST|nr:hypothetical protein RRG08_041449 [Elysia crispata]